MPNVSEYSGLSMANIASISGLDVPSGGLSANSVTNSGVQMYGSSVVWANDDVTADFNIGPAITNHTFTKIVGSESYLQFHALKSDGTLWYWAKDNTLLSSSQFTADGTWRQYGSGTDWEDICGGELTFGAIRNGNIWFLGAGSYRQRGDGSTSNVIDWTQVNSAGNWVKIHHGYRMAWAINSSGEAYSTGYGYSYMSGQGITQTIDTFTREQNNLSNIVDVATGYRCTFLLNSSGDVYFTGTNANGFAGPAITSTGDKNGPILAVDSSSHYRCAKVCGHSYHGGCHIDVDGYLRFNGEGSSRLRLDNSTSDAKLGSSGLQLTSAGNGWTYYDSLDLSGNSAQHLGIGIKGGAFWIGGEDSLLLKEAFGQGSNLDWYEVRTGVTVAFQRNDVLVAG